MSYINEQRKKINQAVLEATYKAQKKYGFKIGTGEHATWNNEADAFKHAYMQWYLADKGLFNIVKGNSFAKLLGDQHERETPNAPVGERNMDLWNNAIGREIYYELKNMNSYDILDEKGKEELVAKKIVEKMKAGEMITNPADKRNFENMELERLTEKDRVFYKDEMLQFDQKLKDLYSDSYLNQAIDNYWKIPTKDELDKQVKSGSLIYVEDYTRSDGSKVQGYYRRKPIR